MRTRKQRGPRRFGRVVRPLMLSDVVPEANPLAHQESSLKIARLQHKRQGLIIDMRAIMEGGRPLRKKEIARYDALAKQINGLLARVERARQAAA